MSLNPTQFDITEGRIAFIVKAGQVSWNDNQVKVLVKLSKDSNFISLIKDEKNQLVFTHFSLEYGQTILTVDAKDLPSSRDLPFILSWSVSDKKIGLSINGTLRKEESMPTPINNGQ